MYRFKGFFSELFQKKLKNVLDHLLKDNKEVKLLKQNSQTKHFFTAQVYQLVSPIEILFCLHGFDKRFYRL